MLRDAGVADGAQVHGDQDRPRCAAAVSQAWDLAAIEREYEQFWPRWRAGDHALAGRVALVHAWRRFPAIDRRCRGNWLPRGGGAGWPRPGCRQAARDQSAAQAEWKWRHLSLTRRARGLERPPGRRGRATAHPAQ